MNEYTFEVVVKLKVEAKDVDTADFVINEMDYGFVYETEDGKIIDHEITDYCLMD